jgi:hypothetical protein
MSSITSNRNSAKAVMTNAALRYLLRLAAVREVAQSGDAAVEVFLKGRRETLTDNYRIP